MSKRQRLTSVKKEASPPPATPGYAEYFSEEPHPAAYEDPKADQYMIGGPSEFAEDPHPPPYEQPEHPATPWEGSDHPANKKAAQIRQAAERKAAKCVRIAQHMLGKKATPAQIEDQALDLMDMPDTQLNTTLRRLGGDFMAQDDLFGQDDEKEGHDVFDVYDLDEDDLISRDEWGGSDEVFDVLDSDGDEMLDVEEVSMGLGPEFSRLASALQGELKSLRTEVAGLKKAMGQNDPGFMAMDEMSQDDDLFGVYGQDDDDIMSMYGQDDDDAEAEQMLAQMLAQEEEAQDEEAQDDETEAMLAEMLAEEAKKSQGDEEEAQDDEEAMLQAMVEEAAKAQEEEKESCNMACDAPTAQDDFEFEEEVEEVPLLAAEQDPMGLMDEGGIAEDDSVLAQLYGERYAAKKSEDEDDEDDDEGSDDEGGDEGDDSGDDEADETSDNDDEDDEDKDEKEAKKKAALKRRSAKKSQEEEAQDEEAEDEKEGKKKSGKKAARKPRPRTANAGIKTVGSVQKTASHNEIDDLSRLWSSAPDVSEHFK